MPFSARLFAWLSRIRALFGARRLDEDFSREIAAHLEMLAEDYARRGMTPAEARREAVLRFGGPMQIQESNRDRRSLPFVETTLQDVKYAYRSLRRQPTFALVAIATLAVGIGAGTAVFSFAGAVLLRPLPYSRPHELVRAFEANPLRRWTRNIASPANYADWKKQNSVFTDLAAYEQFSNNGSGAGFVYLTGQGEPQALTSLGVTGNLFRVLGASTLMGRTFTDDETFEGKARVAVLSYGLWQSVFGGHADVIGKTVTLSGRTYSVVGVMPRGFFFPGKDVQLWLPVGYSPNAFIQNRRPHYLGVIGRLKSGVALAQASQDMDGIARALEQQYPDTNTEMGVHLEGFQDSLAFESRPALLMLSGAVALLFVIVCVNIANLQLGRGAGRAKELGIRTALGAGRGRLVRQLFTESVLLSAFGGAIGIGLAWMVHRAMLAFAPAAVPLFADVRLDGTVVAFAAGLSLVAPIVFGIVPALNVSRSDRLTDRADAGSRERTALRSLLIASEVALSIVLVVGAVLLVRSLLRLQTVDPGFAPDHSIAFTIALPAGRYPDAGKRFVAFDEIERRLRQQPGVNAAGASSTIALRGTTWSGDSTIEGRAPTDFERELQHASVTPGYIAAAGGRLITGRMLDQRDVRDKPPVTLVNETLARQYFRGQPAVGKRITFGRPTDNSPWVEIVGIIADEKQDGLDAPAKPEAYTPLAQRMQNPMTFVVRSSLDSESAVAMAREQVHAVDKDLALMDVTTLANLMDDSLSPERFRMMLLSTFAAVALVLAALGIYGVLAYFVASRTRELGIRLALGAAPAAVFRLVIRQGMAPVAIGAAIGIAAAVPLTILTRTLLFGVEPIDPPTYAIALIALAGIAVAACAVPALRATRVDPLVALRDE